MGLSLVMGVSVELGGVEKLMEHWKRRDLVSLGTPSSHTHAVPTPVYGPQPTVPSLPERPRTVDAKYST